MTESSNDPKPKNDTLYDVLGVGVRATRAEIRHRYRLLIKQATAENQDLAALTEAISTLGNTTRRQRYDATLAPQTISIRDGEPFQSTSTGDVDEYLRSSSGTANPVSLDVVIANIEGSFRAAADHLRRSLLDVDDGVRELDDGHSEAAVRAARRRAQRIRRAEELVSEAQALALEERRSRIEEALATFVDDLEAAREALKASASETGRPDAKGTGRQAAVPARLERDFARRAQRGLETVIAEKIDADREYEEVVLRVLDDRDEVAATARQAETEDAAALSAERRAGLRQLIEDSGREAGRLTALVTSELSKLAGTSGQPFGDSTALTADIDRGTL